VARTAGQQDQKQIAHYVKSLDLLRRLWLGFATQMKYMDRLLILSGLLLCGCTEMQSLRQPETQAWLALHAVDTAQTYRIAESPNCYAEGDGITRSLIGPHPSKGEVLAWSVASAGVHIGVTELLLRNDHPKLAKAWSYVRIGITADAISQNHSIGIRLGSPNRHEGPCFGEPAKPQQRPIG
jgi:hypothetical protein